MLKSCFTAVITIALGCTNTSLQTSGMTAPIKIVISFSTEDLVGQMTQIDISVLMADDTRTLYESARCHLRPSLLFGQQINAAALFHPDMVYESLLVIRLLPGFLGLPCGHERLRLLVKTRTMTRRWQMQLYEYDRHRRVFHERHNGTAGEERQYLSRVKVSARRVDKLKQQLGLYDNPVPGEANLEMVGTRRQRLSWHANRSFS
ncbi:Glycoside hydrolase [Phytophthora palmivora]|uniref:Glycoside hydrolase n=1 Tax=Phytophthora palmivora TaxID=4796 RepID=A0A2P4YHN9_9STRA|nr:Glycoside hydrolase [Phytophthora palmivora]